MAEAETPVRYGVEAGEQQMTGGSRWPYLRPKEGDRARFHFLTTGKDPWLAATKFHSVKREKYYDNLVCLSGLTRGEESCTMCDNGATERRNMFAVWVMVDYILHPNDNPDEEADSWEQKKLKIQGTDGKTRERAVFMEVLQAEIDDDTKLPGQTRLLWLPAGRQKVWWSQFMKAFMDTGDLQKHFYELHRVGSGLNDTNYTLNTIKEDPLNKDVLERADVKDLPSIEDVWRSGLENVPSGNSVMGADGLDEGGSDDLPKADTEGEPTPATASDLI